MLQIIPEAAMAVGALASLMVGARQGRAAVFFTVFGVLAAALGLWQGGFLRLSGNDFSAAMDDTPYKFLIVFGTLAAFAAAAVDRDRSARRFEFYVLTALSAVGMLAAVAARSYIGLYIALELQALAGYAAAAVCRDDRRVLEGVLKYFIAGAFAGGVMLFGIALLYAYTGSFDFAVAREAQALLPVRLAVALIFAGLLFKAAAAPFHAWAADLYVSAPLGAVTFSASASKAAAFAVLLQQAFAWHDIPVFAVMALSAAVLSAVVGLAGAVAQTDVRRLLAFSSVQHAGFFVLILAALPKVPQAENAALHYAVVYVLTAAAPFLLLTYVRRSDGSMLTRMSELRGFAQRAPRAALLWSILMASFAGLPPLAGFFIKVAAIKVALGAGYLMPTAIIVFCGAVAAYYYMRVVRAMYFEPAEDRSALFAPFSWASASVIALGVAVCVLYWPMVWWLV